LETITLASKSPQRKTILEQIGIPFLVRYSTIDEALLLKGDVKKAVQNIARAKVDSVLSSLDYDPLWIVGADTIVYCNSTALGKPENLDAARIMLNTLSGQKHDVISGVALYNARTGNMLTEYDVSEVSFARLSEDEIEWYLRLYEWRGAAGAYRIQEKGALFIKSITGSFSNIMGLPIHTFYGMLGRSNYKFDMP
jgi:septum formation protein